MELDGSLSVRDPIVGEMSWTIKDLLTNFDPMPPEEYEQYYNEALKPLKDQIEELSDALDRL